MEVDTLFSPFSLLSRLHSVFVVVVVATATAPATDAVM